MGDVNQTDLAAAAELSASLRSAATGAGSSVTAGTCDAALGLASASVAAASASSMNLVQRLAERCQELSIGVELAAQKTARADRI